MEEYKILAMNFGSTSTKVAAYEGDTQLLQKVFHHSPEDLQGVSSMEDNAALRKPLILNYLKEQGVDLKEFDAIVGRGGLVRPLLGGTYAVNEKMLEDLRSCTYGTHVCNLGGILAAEIGQELGKPAYVVDPLSLTKCPTWPSSPAVRTSPAVPSSTPSTRRPLPSATPPNTVSPMTPCASSWPIWAAVSPWAPTCTARS